MKAIPREKRETDWRRLERKNSENPSAQAWRCAKCRRGLVAKLPTIAPYLSAASLNALAARRRTTVLALILIASPVAGLRPMRALRCALTARPIPGMTNLPALLHSFTARLKSSSKNEATCFLDTGFSFVLTFSAMCAMILDLLIGFAIVLPSPL